jgi:opacity protein-like surface antigen
MFRNLMLTVVVTGLLAGPAVAQTTGGQFHVGPRIGYIKYANKTGIKDAALFGLDALYYVSPNLGVGFALDVARPNTDGNFFPAEMSFGDTTFIYAVSQPLTILQFALQAEATTGGRLAPFLGASIGGYRVSLDPQVAAGQSNFTELGFSFGGGIAFAVGEATSVRLEARDYVFTKFNRDNIYPVDSRFRPTRFPDVLPEPAPFDGTAHNIHVGLAFTFTPGGSR